MPETPAPVVELTDLHEPARDIVIIGDRNVPLVPNIGVIGGSHSVLVVDTGMGPRNAQRTLDFAREYARGRRLYLTTTHFHPEHAFGANVFATEATYLINRAQADDLTQRAPGYLPMFRAMGPAVARELDNVTFTEPDIVYDSAYHLDLGGRTVHMRATGRGHTRGDQVITVPDQRILFTGDLVETAQFSIFPWFPPHDVDVFGHGWINVMERLIIDAPAIVVPGHGGLTDASALSDVHTYLERLREHTWRRRDASIPEPTTVEEVEAEMARLYPTWTGREWIAKGVGCFYHEHPQPAGVSS
ncbi:MBL fold metallo-hydrolase [Streptomyces sp. NPDC098789]|uniref:MBL fold metallo-hydrolase n=1 Tax=Streptomyces sp. NPDC098789 TaxID=3366098 RepID=UPI0038040BC2